MKIKLKNSDGFHDLLVRNGYSKRSFAKAADIGEATLLQICNGHRHASPRTAKRITQALSIDFDEIFEISRDQGGFSK